LDLHRSDISNVWSAWVLSLVYRKTAKSFAVTSIKA